MGWLLVWSARRQEDIQARVRYSRLPLVGMTLGCHATVNRQNVIAQEGEWVGWLFLWSEILQQGAVADGQGTGRAQTSGVGEVLKPKYCEVLIAELREISIVHGRELAGLVLMW